MEPKLKDTLLLYLKFAAENYSINHSDNDFDINVHILMKDGIPSVEKIEESYENV